MYNPEVLDKPQQQVVVSKSNKPSATVFALRMLPINPNKYLGLIVKDEDSFMYIFLQV